MIDRRKYRRYLKTKKIITIKRSFFERLEKIGGIGGIKSGNKAIDYLIRERKEKNK